MQVDGSKGGVTMSIEFWLRLDDYFEGTFAENQSDTTEFQRVSEKI